MNCWNCKNVLDELLLCSRCGMPQRLEFVGPFDALGLPPRLTWDLEELRSTYERLAQSCHPDLFRAHQDERVLTAARVAMGTLNDAYRVLQEPIERLRYVLAAGGRSPEVTRTVPDGLQESAQIMDRVLRQVEDARKRGNREAWEAEQDHLASLEVQTETAQQRSDGMLQSLLTEWDDAVRRAGDDWPEMPSTWRELAVRWIGEREYLEALKGRMQAGRRWQEPSAVT